MFGPMGRTTFVSDGEIRGSKRNQLLGYLNLIWALKATSKGVKRRRNQKRRSRADGLNSTQR